jgi:hypothetical protein
VSQPPSLPDPPPPPPRRNRRASYRRLSRRGVRVTCQRGDLGLGADLALALLDLSETGARLAVKEELEPGEEVEVNLEGIWHRRPIRILGNVTWCAVRAGDRLEVGIRFQKRLPYADLTQLAEDMG